MIFIFFITVVIFLYVVCDLNYLIRTCFTIWCGRIYQGKYSLHESTTIYGMGTFQDCDVRFRCIRLARLVRDLDFARYHFYDRTGIYKNSRKRGIKSLQGSTLTVCIEPVPLFKFYKIITKLVYWDERSLFLEHEVITLHDKKERCIFVSRQFAIGKDKASTSILLDGLTESEKPACPENIQKWLESMEISRKQLRKDIFVT